MNFEEKGIRKERDFYWILKRINLGFVIG